MSGPRELADRIELVFLPGYSPELNRTELRNRDVKGNALGPTPAARPRRDGGGRKVMLALQPAPPHIAANYFDGEYVGYAKVRGGDCDGCLPSGSKHPVFRGTRGGPPWRPGPSTRRRKLQPHDRPVIVHREGDPLNSAAAGLGSRSQALAEGLVPFLRTGRDDGRAGRRPRWACRVVPRSGRDGWGGVDARGLLGRDSGSFPVAV